MTYKTEDQWADEIKAVIEAARADGHSVEVYGDYGYGAELIIGQTTIMEHD